jgi:hypothetical protein
MKHNQLRAIAHNVAASIGEGCSFLVNVYDTGMHEALEDAPHGVITADFLRGTIEPPAPESQLSIAVSLVPAALPELCAKHGASVSDFLELKVRYAVGIEGRRMTVVVVDANGRRSETDYSGFSSKRVKSVDDLGRLRARPVRKSPA